MHFLAGSNTVWCYIFHNSIITSLWRHNDVFASGVRWGTIVSMICDAIVSVGLLKFICGFLKSQQLGIMTHQRIKGTKFFTIVTRFSELRSYFHSCIIYKKPTKTEWWCPYPYSTHTSYKHEWKSTWVYARWIAVSSMKSWGTPIILPQMSSKSQWIGGIIC